MSIKSVVGTLIELVALIKEHLAIDATDANLKMTKEKVESHVGRKQFLIKKSMFFVFSLR